MLQFSVNIYKLLIWESFDS